MPSPKRHHYLPRFYLQGFCRADTFWAYDRKLNEFREQTPTNTAVETHFYAIREADGSRDTRLEDTISQIETYAAPIVKKADNRQPLTGEDKLVLSIFVSLFKFRVPEFAKEQQHLRREILRKLGPMVERTSRLSRSETPKPLISPTGERSYDLAEVIEEIEALETDADASHNDVLRMVVPLTGEISRYILQMDWIIARSPADASFVTTDNPFVLTAPHGYDPQSPFGVGIATLGAQEIIPLTARPCLVILDKGSSVDFANISRAEVRRINLAVALNCDRYLFARDEAQIRNVVKRTRFDQLTQRAGIRLE